MVSILIQSIMPVSYTHLDVYKRQKWGRAKLNYLKQNEQGLYTSLLLKNQLNEYLQDIDSQANLMYDHLIKQLILQYNITEQLKQYNQMLWVKQMNMINKIAEEIVLNEDVYKRQLLPKSYRNACQIIHYML